MSEQQNEQAQPIAAPGGPQDAPTAQEAEHPANAPAPATEVAGDEIPLRLIKVEDMDRHWNVAKGIWEQVTHAETGEPNYFYSLVGTIDGVDVELSRFNAGRIDTRVAIAKRANQSSGA